MKGEVSYNILQLKNMIPLFKQNNVSDIDHEKTPAATTRFSKLRGVLQKVENYSSDKNIRAFCWGKSFYLESF